MNNHAMPNATGGPAATAARPLNAAMRTVLAGAAAALLMAAALVAAPSASAHDSLIGSTPEDGATVTGPLDTITMSFSGSLKPIGTAVSLSDAAGTRHDTETSVSGNVLTIDLGEPLPAGEYTLTWRTVSSDGHPIEGTRANKEALAFSVKGGPSPAASTPASAPASPTTAAGAAAASAPASDAGTEEQTAPAGGMPPALIWLIIAAAVVAAAGIVVAKARRQGGPGK